MGDVRRFKCPECEQSFTAEEWTDKANESGEYPETMCPIEFEDDPHNRSEYYWNCPGCDEEVDGDDIEEVEP